MAAIDNEAPGTQAEHYVRKIQDLTKDTATYDRNKADQIHRIAGKLLVLLPTLTGPSTLIPSSDER